MEYLRLTVKVTWYLSGCTLSPGTVTWAVQVYVPESSLAADDMV